MAIEVLAAAWELELPGTRKLVLLALADHADTKTRKCWPSVARLATRTGLTHRSVQACLKQLADAGFIKKDANALRGRGRATVYVVLPQDAELSTGAMWKTQKGEGGSPPGGEKGERGSSKTTEWVQTAAVKGEGGSPQSVEPSNRSNRHAREAREAEPATPGAGAPQLDFEARGWSVAPPPRATANGTAPAPARRIFEGLAASGANDAAGARSSDPVSVGEILQRGEAKGERRT